jgi:hypothetical protein
MMIFSCNTPNKIDEISYPQLFIKSIKVEDILLCTSNTSTHLPQSELPVGLEYLSHSTDYLPDTIIYFQYLNSSTPIGITCWT